MTATVKVCSPPNPNSGGTTATQHDEHHGHRHRDQERLLAHALGDLAPGDERDRGAAAQPAHAATALRKSSVSVGRSSAKWVTLPAARAASSSASGPAPSRSAIEQAAGAAVDDLGARHARQPVLSGAGDRDAHGRAGRPALAQLLDAPRRHEPPVLDDRHRLAQPLHELELVRGEHDRHALVGQPLQDAAQHVDADRVEPRERLVEHQQLRAVHERDAELDPLLVAERERLDAVARALGQPEPLEPALRGRRCLGARQAVQRGEVGELVEHAHLRVQAALLRHVAEAGARVEVDRPAAPADLAAVGLEHAEDDAHRRGLAGAVRTHEAEELPRLDREGEAVEGDDVAVAAREFDDLQHPHSGIASCRRMSGAYRPPAPKVVVYMAAWRGFSWISGAWKAKPRPISR